MSIVRWELLTVIIAASVVLGQPTSAYSQNADVPVVRNQPAAEAPVSWTVDAEPVLEIGGSQTDPDQQLFRVVRAARLDDGRIVIANSGSYTLRFYDSDGSHLADVGGEGEGPGDFRSFSSVQVTPHDSIYVYDEDLRRVTVFNSSGDLSRTATIHGNGRPPSELRRFRDGRWYSVDGEEITSGPAGTIQRDTAHFSLFRANLQMKSRLLALPGIMTANASYQGRSGYRAAAFTPRPLYDEFDNCLYLTSGDSFEIRILSSEGRVIRIVRNAGERRAVSPADVSPWIDYALEEQGITNPKKRKLARKLLQTFPRPDSLPVYNDLVVDEEGYIWLQLYAPPSGASRNWVVLNPEGRLTGRVRMPAAVDVFDVGRDWILANWKDDVGREYVQLYRLHRDTRDSSPQPAACMEDA